MNRRLPELLAQRLTRPLPGPMLRRPFESRPPGGDDDRPPSDARPAAVLVLLYPHEGRWHVPLTLRPGHLPVHPGQVSLPGGAVEPDETSPQAALREFAEELGAGPEGIELLGRLSEVYVSTSNYLITPWVAAAQQRPAMRPNPEEVEQLLEVPLERLCDPSALRTHTRQGPQGPYQTPHFVWKAYRIWGATCMILGELVTLLREPGLEPG